MRNNTFRVVAWIGTITILMIAVAGGCRRGINGGSAKVEITQNNYMPELGRTFPGYRGKSIYLANIDNQANNTTMWYYYNPQGSMTYESWPSLTSYFWYCIQKAFQSAGLEVHSMDQASNAPEVDITLESITDQQFQYMVSVHGKGASFQKRFTVTMEPAVTTDSGLLEKRAYKMIDKMVRAILEDRGFDHAIRSTR